MQKYKEKLKVESRRLKVFHSSIFSFFHSSNFHSFCNFAAEIIKVKEI